jgi:DNA-binding transcriptional ArsR family regulator
MRLGADDLVNCRFAVSPLWEVNEAIRTLARPTQWSYHRPWLRSTAAAVRELDLGAMWLLMPRRGYFPDFLCKAPRGGLVASFAEELAEVRASDPAQVRREIATSLADTPGAAESRAGQALLADPEEALRELTGALERTWEAVIAPHWTRLRALLVADVAFHSRRLAEGGLARLFPELHPMVSYEASGDGGTVTIHRPHDNDRTLAGEGVVLIPSVFTWPEVASGVAPPHQPALAYPARGIGGLWSDARPEPSAALAKLLGRHRAAVLTALVEPASTTALAGRLGLAPSSVSAHLRALRDAGLLVSRRERHEVLYERTPLGIALGEGGV